MNESELQPLFELAHHNVAVRVVLAAIRYGAPVTQTLVTLAEMLAKQNTALTSRLVEANAWAMPFELRMRMMTDGELFVVDPKSVSERRDS